MQKIWKENLTPTLKMKHDSIFIKKKFNIIEDLFISRGLFFILSVGVLVFVAKISALRTSLKF
jgi:hypothetical protein